jgi:ribonuclease HIII
LNAIPGDLQRLLDRHEVEVTGSRNIDHGEQYHLKLGAESNNLNVFHTGKVSVDGKPSSLRSLLEAWRVSHQGKARRQPGVETRKATARPRTNSTPRIGTDEAGKGEYLGPLVVAGVRVLSAEIDQALREIGARDSKELGVAQVRKIAAGIKEILGEGNVCVVSLEPKEYEARRAAAGSNVNRLLGELNVQIIDKLKDEVECIVVDAFGSKARSYIEPHVPEGVRLEVRPRAEDDVAVAAASILARARYLEEMERLSEWAGFELPRGSTHVTEAAARVYRERGMEGLREVAKVHFATTEQVIRAAEKTRAGGGP